MTSTILKSPARPAKKAAAISADAARMRELAAFTALTLDQSHPTPFGAVVVETATGRLVTRQVNKVALHLDPTEHAEVHAVRKACKKLKSLSLRGHTLYTTCEPCPMCMAACLWSGLDRVVFGATIADAAKVCSQIYVSAKTLARKSDLRCEVVGPVERKTCVGLFTHPKMAAIFKTWRHGK
jgi:guanine deaminase